MEFIFGIAILGGISWVSFNSGKREGSQQTLANLFTESRQPFRDINHR